MKKDNIKEGNLVIDRWYPEYGTGRITNVKKNCIYSYIPC